ncbi:MAG: ABC transporter [Clostridiales bacterium GWF2_38_85]|nr:MAG: ABC transporter [Clostridiales bacterium GWF2_38_85]HBL85259.1 ABC transporter ATP-binding protein [Clostridiales bacterium]
MKKYFEYIKPQIPKMSFGLFIKFIGTIMDLLLPWILAFMIDDVVPTKNKSNIIFWGCMMVLFSILAVTANIVANRMASRVAMNTTQKIRYDLFKKILYLSCKQIDDFTIPSLESRLTTDTYNLHQMTGSMQRLGVRAPILLIGGIIITLSLDPILSLTLISVLPIIGYTVYKISKKGIPLYTEQQKATDNMVRVVRENAVGVRIIRALSKSDFEQQRFDSVNNEVTGKETKASVIMAISNPLMNLFFYLGLTMVILVGAFRVNSGFTQAGTIIAFLTYFTIILNAMLSITRMFVMLSKAIASAKRINEVLTAEEDLKMYPIDHVDNDYHIEFNNVSFSYNKKQNNVDDISFKLKKGETLGIIGATGCGKSTIINLLIRFYDPDKGQIRINGDNINSIPFNKLHSKFGIVFQNDILFADSIGENISFGRKLPNEEIEKAAEFAQAKLFIDDLEEGYSYNLTSKGTNISGGQKQRLLISRAIASNPEILILDDSSSALDYKTDAEFRKVLLNNYKDTTTIIIAQRISSIRNADLIIVMDEGKIIVMGKHSDLIKDCTLYKQISDSQMGEKQYE